MSTPARRRLVESISVGPTYANSMLLTIQPHHLFMRRQSTLLRLLVSRYPYIKKEQQGPEGLKVSIPQTMAPEWRAWASAPDRFNAYLHELLEERERIVRSLYIEGPGGENVVPPFQVWMVSSVELDDNDLASIQAIPGVLKAGFPPKEYNYKRFVVILVVHPPQFPEATRGDLIRAALTISFDEED